MKRLHQARVYGSGLVLDLPGLQNEIMVLIEDPSEQEVYHQKDGFGWLLADCWCCSAAALSQIDRSKAKYSHEMMN